MSSWGPAAFRASFFVVDAGAGVTAQRDCHLNPTTGHLHQVSLPDLMQNSWRVLVRSSPKTSDIANQGLHSTGWKNGRK